MFIGEKGRLLLPHFMETPKIIIDNKYEFVDTSKFEENGLLEKTLLEITKRIPYYIIMNL